MKVVNKELEGIERDLILSMENENLQNFKDSRFGLVYLREDLYASIEDSDKCFGWLEENNMHDVIRQTVHSKTLSAICKESGEIPGVKTYFQTKVGFRREKKDAS